MKKILSFLLAVMLLTGMAQAASISQEQATKVCANFLLQKQINGYTESIDFQFYKAELKDGNVVFYVFQCKPIGYVIISASSHFDPVVCYSFESDFQHNPGFDYALEAYSNIISTYEKRGQDFRPGIAERWQKYLSNDFAAEKTRNQEVKALVTSKWNQDMYFNTYCPWDRTAAYGCDGRVYTGCVSTAMAQVMNYHGHPYTGLGGSSYIPGNYGRYTVKFFQQTYNYNAMPNVPSGYSNEMAKLIHHCGVAVQMGYTTQGSGANSVTASEAMKNHFKYDSAWICPRALYDQIGDWYNALKTDLNARRPMYYAAHNGNDGHAFVVDGYDENDKFHVNWGWGGSGDGYFTISDNNLSDMNGFIYDAEAIRLAYPITDAPGVCSGHYRIDAAKGTFYSNMPTIDYAPDNTCEWMIAAPEASKYVFHFDRFETEQDADFLTIYNGPSTSDGVAASFSGSTIPSDVTVTADSVLVVFTTDGQNEFPGFQISYTATTAAQYCSASDNITSAGPITITDGSGDAQYRNNTVCTWNIRPSGMSHCYFSFPQIELGSGDFIEIYNATTNPNTLLYRFDKNNFPAQDVIRADYGKLMVRFVADNWDVDNGFTITVEPVVAVNDYAGVSELRVFPNPATDRVNVSFFASHASDITCQIVDMSGKLVESRSYSQVNGFFEDNFNITNLAKGIYFLRLQTEEGTSIEKIVRQ